VSVHNEPELLQAESRLARLDLDQIYREHAATVSRWVRQLSGEMECADALQEVFEVAQRRAATFRAEAKVSTWLYSITVRVVSARRRKARLRRFLFRRAEAELALYSSSPETPDQELDRDRAQRIVYAVLERLSERDRTLIVLFELDRCSSAEIAEILGLSANAVAVALHRARDRFGRVLKAHFAEQKPEDSSR